MPEPTTSGRWSHVREGRDLGPVTTDDLRRLLDSGAFTPTDSLVPEINGRASSVAGEPTTTAEHRVEPPTGMARPPLPDLTGYEILGEIGQGGMGVVYKARHLALGRLVALKTLLPSGGADPGSLERFSREARALARLHHPGIVQIYEVGEHDGRPFFAMEFVPAGNLAQRLARQPQPAADAARMVESLARAVHAAHQAGIVHRDLKPGNVLVAADGTLKVSDFGLVKDLSDEQKRTQTGAVVGTVEYMAPEQARGDLARIGPPTDVYALGVILYEALVGFTPFHGPVMAVLHAVAEREPDAPSRLRPGVPRDLERVCLKCLEKEPARRYASAAELADELARFRKGEPVRVRPLGPAGRAWRWCRRNRAVAALLALVGLTLLSGTGVASYFAVVASANAEREKQEKLNVRKQEAQAQRLLYGSQTPLSFRLWQEGSVPQARATLDSTRAEQRGWEFGYLDWLFNKSHTTIRAHEGGALSVCFSPDGTRLASSGWDGAVRVWDARTGRQVFAHAGLPGGPRRVRFSPDGTVLAVTAATAKDAVVTLWDARTGRELRQLRGAGGVSGLCFSRDGNRLAGGGSEKIVKVWEVATGAELLELKGHTEMINAVDFSRDGKRLASAGGERVVRVWDLDTGKQALTLSGHTSFVYDVCFGPDGRLLTVSNDQTARVWDAGTGGEEVVFREHKGSIECGCFSRDGKLVASAGSEDLIRVWEARTGRQVLALRGHEERVSDVAFSPDGKRIATASADGTVKLWDAVRGQEPRAIEGHGESVLSVRASADGGQILTAGWDGTARLWDVKSGRQRLAFEGHTDGLYAACFSPDGKRIATASADKTARVWDARTGKELFALKGHTGSVASVCFDREGGRVATAGEDGTLRVWDARTGAARLVLKRPAPVKPPAGGPFRIGVGEAEPAFRSVCFSPDGTRLVTASAGVPSKPRSAKRQDWISMTSDDRVVRVFDARTGEQVLALEGHADEVHAACFSEDGTRIASASSDRTVKVWDARTGEEKLTLRGHARGVQCVCFSRDGGRLASAGWDAAVKVWDAQTGQELLAVKGHEDLVRAVCFSPDGSRLLTAGDDGRVRVWGADPPD